MNLKPPDFDSQDRNQETLHSWKEIAAYIQRNEASARRWEREEGLPVHRHSHKIRSSVFAYPSEIDAWRAGRRTAPEPALTARPWWRPVAIGITTLLCLIMVGNRIRPMVASADTKQTARQVWAPATSDSSSMPILRTATGRRRNGGWFDLS